MEYLESSANFESTIDLDGFLMILKRRRLPALVIFTLIFAATILVSLSKKQNYVSEGKLLIKNPSKISSITEVGQGVGRLDSIDNAESSPLNTEKEVLLSVSLIGKTIETLDLKGEEKTKPLKIEQFIDKINVSQISGTDILKVVYEDRDPEKAAAVVNTLMNFYLQNNIATNRAEAKSAREFLEQQLPNVQTRVTKAERDLYKFKEKNALSTSIEQQKNLAGEILADLDQKIIQIRSEYADVNNHIKLLRNNLTANSKEAVSITSLDLTNRSSEEDALLGRLEELESELAIQRSRLTLNHPMVSTLEAQVEASKKQLLGKLEVKRKNLASQIATLSQEKSAYKQKLMIFPSLEQQKQRLEDQLQTGKSTYSKLQNNLEAVKLAENQTVANANILSPALVPEKPDAPSKLLVVLQGLLLASVTSIGSIWLIEQKDKSLKTVDEVKERFGLPVLAAIPQINKSLSASPLTSNPKNSNSAIVVRDNFLTSISQLYWTLLTNLQFLQSNHGVKVIVVTSSISQEGKSKVSFDLSQSMAQKGKKVLLVDADLRPDEQHSTPNLSKQVGLSFNEVGLSDVLALEINYQTAIKQVMENIDILPAGLVTPDAISRLDSSAMATLIDKFASDYDFVIIDTPPLVANFGALVMGKMADGIVLVVRPGLVDAVAINIAKERLEQSEQNVLGMVVNGVIRDNEPHQYYC